MIVGMDRLFSAPISGQHFVCAARDHFVRVHVGRSSGTRLEDIQNELAVQPAFGHLMCGIANRRGYPGGNSPSSAFTTAADSFTRPSALINGLPKVLPLTGKFSTARCVWAPK